MHMLITKTARNSALKSQMCLNVDTKQTTPTLNELVLMAAAEEVNDLKD